jgi:multicomponent Na+:H+ antiporter subunit D
LGISLVLVRYFAAGHTAITALWGMRVYIDSVSALFMTIISMVSIAAALYASSYMHHYSGRTKFYGLFMVMLGGMNGLVMAADLFNLYVFFEAAAIASYVLVAFTLEWDGIEAAFKYIVLSSISTLMILFGSALLFYHFGTLSIRELGMMIDPSQIDHDVLVAVALLLCGFGFKAATIPFHVWLPDAHASAPAPISAMLSGVVIKVLGIYCLLRVVFGMCAGAGVLLRVTTILGLSSVIIGGILGLRQWDRSDLFWWVSAWGRRWASWELYFTCSIMPCSNLSYS